MTKISARVLKMDLFRAPVAIEPGSGAPVIGRVHKPVMQADNVAPCSSENGCPIGIRIRECAMLFREKKVAEAWKLLKEDNPFPATTGRVCYHPCEDVCNRREFDEPIAIHTAIERFLGDRALNLPESIRPVAKEEKIAVVGSGPAGLSAAYFLAREGHRVTVFEKLPVAGGMLSVGIPGYRLPRNILEAEINAIKQLGVEIVLNCAVGENYSFIEIQRNYDAVLIATGAHMPQSLSIPGEGAKGVFQGVSFLKEVNLEKRVSVGNRVAVIGGSNVAIDAARCCVRLGSNEVTILYRRSREEMPAHVEEIAAAEPEGIKIEYLVSPQEILTDGNGVTGVRCMRMQLGELDSSGRRSPIPIEDQYFYIDVDMVIVAIGQKADLSLLKEAGFTSKLNSIPDRGAMISSTSPRNVFAAGDVVYGPKTVTNAIAEGKKSAKAIAAKLRGQNSANERHFKTVSYEAINTDYFVHRQRAPESSLPIKKRVLGFEEVNLGLNEEAALFEVQRCFICGKCSDCEVCSSYCPEGIISHGQGVIQADLDYCKGCGICANECPRSAIRMELEM